MKKSKAPGAGIDHKQYPVLSKLITDKRAIVSLQQLQELTVQNKLVLIEELSRYIITSPEDHIAHIQTMLHLSEDNSITVTKMALMALTEVFKDTAPLYEVDVDNVKDELKKQIPKDERKALMFDLSYTEFYKKYIQIVGDLTKLRYKDYIKNLGLDVVDEETEKKYKNLCKEYERVGIICLTELISVMFHFNYRKEIAVLIAKKLKSRDDDIRNIAAKCISNFFADSNPGTFEMKFSFISTISKVFSTSPEKSLPDNYLNVLNSLNIVTTVIEEEASEKDELAEEKKKWKDKKEKIKYLDKELKKKIMKQHKALQKEVKEDLKLAKATVDAKRVKYLKSEILKKVFYIYFKILKYHKPSKFFNLAMNGILKFVHLIDHEFIFDLLENLRECGAMLREFQLKHPNNSEHIVEYRVTCVFTTTEIVNLVTKAVELDDREAIQTLYQLIIDFTAHPNHLKNIKLSNLELIIKTLNKIFLQKRQLSIETCASFIKKLLEMCQVCEDRLVGLVKTILFIVKMMLHKYPTINKMLDKDNEGYGLDKYNPKMEDPQATNASKTCILDDLEKIKKKFPKDSLVVSLANKISGNERLAINIASLTVIDFYKRFGPSETQ